MKHHEDKTCKLRPGYVSKTYNNLKCRFCNSDFKRPAGLAIHERVCVLNPNRKPLENNGNGWKYVKTHQQTDRKWSCLECGETFTTKNNLYNHKHEAHNLAYRNTQKVCELCHEQYKTKREHDKVCKCKRHGFNFKWTDAEKEKLRNARIKYLKENPDKHPWKKSDKFKSKPCEHLKEVLKEKGFYFVEEYTDTRWEHNYSLDIAFLDKKIAIEVNGNQHYNSNRKLNYYYQKRHDYLTSQGWNILEIHYTWCYVEDKIKEIVKAIENNTTDQM